MNTRPLACTVVGAIGVMAGCSDRLVVPNYQSPTAASVVADPATAIPLLVNGVLRSDATSMPAYIQAVGVLGREGYNVTSSGALLTALVFSSANGGVNFGPPYQTVRNARNTLRVIEAAGGAVTNAQRAALRGFLHTEIALNLLYAVNTRHLVGITVDVYDDPAKLAPFVSRDSGLTYIATLLDSANAELAAGGESFAPAALPSGFNNFRTPKDFAKFNRALAARVNAYRASLGAAGCGSVRSASCYQLVLADLASSFIDPNGSFASGVFNVYSSAANDLPNTAKVNILAHVKSDSGVQVKADGTNDSRFLAKVVRLASSKPTGVDSLRTNWDFKLDTLTTDPIPIIRNEELILLRAEAKYFTGDRVGALDDINLVRTKAGGLAKLTTFSNDSAFVDELLYNRRWSLLFEGHRWIDMRRFGSFWLNHLTLDRPSHVVTAGLPLPSTECAQRANVVVALGPPPGSGC
jgi:hypothetical protein